MSEQTQSPEAIIIALKARAFDVQEQLAVAQSQGQQLTEALKVIADVVGLSGETIQLADIVEAVKALVPAQGELEVESE